MARLDHAKAGRQARTIHALYTNPPDTDTDYKPADLGPTAHVTGNGTPVHHHGWRTEWDGTPFPVTITYTTQVTQEPEPCTPPSGSQPASSPPTRSSPSPSS